MTEYRRVKMQRHRLNYFGTRATKVWPWLIKVATVAITLQLTAVAIVAVANLVPDSAIIDELRSSTESDAITETSTPQQRTGGMSDHYGECVMFGIGLGEPSHYNWFHEVAMSPTLHNCVYMHHRLAAHDQGKPLESYSKLRYWNGLSVLVRPLLVSIGVNGLRIVAMLALLASILVLGRVLTRAVHRLAPLFLLGPIAAGGDLLGLVEVFHHTLMLSIGILGVAALVHAAAKDGDWRDLGFLAFVVGSIYAFVDLMNFVPGLWAMSASGVAAAVPAAHGVATRSKRMLVTVALWPTGYVSMWAGKWILAALAYSPSRVYDEISGQILKRIDGQTAYSTGKLAAGLTRNFNYWLDQALVPTVLFASGTFAVVAVWRLIRGTRVQARTAAVIAAPSLLVLGFLLLVNSHNEIHYWFEYRSLPMALGILLMALCAATGSSNADDRSGSHPSMNRLRRTTGKVASDDS